MDSLAAHIAILDENGVILAVNAAWRRFASANGMAAAEACLGQDYLKVCESAGEEGAAAAARIRAVLTGEKQHAWFSYPCHGPRHKRWFLCRVTRFSGEGPARLVVAHENITAPRAAELRAHSLAGLLRRSEKLERSVSGILEQVIRADILEPVFLKIAGMVEQQCAGRAAILLSRNGRLDVLSAPRVPEPIRSKLPNLVASLLREEANPDGSDPIWPVPEWKVARVLAGSPPPLAASIRTATAVPIQNGSAELLGCIVLFSESPEPVASESEVLKRAARVALVAVEHWVFSRRPAAPAPAGQPRYIS